MKKSNEAPNQDYKKAIKDYLLSIEEMEKLAKKDPELYAPNLALDCKCLGNVYNEIEDYENAESYLDVAIKLYQELAKQDPQEYEQFLATSYRDIAFVYGNMDDNDKAEKYHFLAHELFEKVVKSHEDYKPKETPVYHLCLYAKNKTNLKMHGVSKVDFLRRVKEEDFEERNGTPDSSILA